MSLGVLGGFELRVDGQAVCLSQTPTRLLVFLALGRHPLARTYVSQFLWPEATERHADGNLRSALWRIGQLGASVIEVSGRQLALGLRVEVDYPARVALARRVVRDPESLSEMDLDDEPFTEDLLPDWYEEWVVAERERYRQLRLHALESLCLELLARRRFGPAIQAGLAAVVGEPLRESANLALIRAYLGEGNASEAIRHYQAFRRLLWNELSVAPSPAMNRLIEKPRQ
jgi:DNA-binding SARP family transcriptional activator